MHQLYYNICNIADIPLIINWQRRRCKNARDKIPLRNVTGNKVTLFRQCLRSRPVRGSAEVSSSEKAPITEKKSVYQRDNAVGLRIIRCRRRQRSANDGVWVTWPRLVAANIKPCHLRVWRTTVIHNIVRPRYLRLASLRACLVVRASLPFLLPTSVSLHRRWQGMCVCERERERESRREMFDRLNETLRHTGNIEFPCVQCIRTTRRTIWNDTRGGDC